MAHTYYYPRPSVSSVRVGTRLVYLFGFGNVVGKPAGWDAEEELTNAPNCAVLYAAGAASRAAATNLEEAGGYGPPGSSGSS